MTRVRIAYQRAKRVLIDTQNVINEAQLFITASSLAYTTILSMIPALALSFVVFRAFGGLDKLYVNLEPFILANLSEGTSQDVMQKIHTLIENVNATTLGAGGFFGLVFTSMSLLTSVENALNRIWRVNSRRTLFQRIAYYWLFITLGPLLMSIILGVATSSSFPLTKILPSGSGLTLLAACLLTLVYKFVPDTPVRWLYAGASGVWTAVIFELTRLAYLVYIQKYASYNRIYGSLASIPILLFWIYLVWLIILAGAALTSTMQKRLDRKRIPEATPPL